MTAVVGTDVALKATVVVGLQDLQNAGVAIAIPVGGLREVTVLEMLDITDMGKSDAVAVLAHHIRHIVGGIRAQAAGAQGQAVVGMVHHLQEAVDVFSIDQQSGQAEDIPGGIVHVDFMIGSEDLAIDAITRDGKTVAIFRDGNWAF